ncbi:MAG TPA: sigma factor G inhibitor Gin [Limnochordia bacterium]|mgnify:CR=1 FL=1|nr:sigma factor G inhibitor Gin [Limnochordia bacterium]
MECLVCRDLVQGEGLEFWGVTICQRCEGRLMGLTAGQPEYDLYVGALRSMWEQRLRAFRDRRLKDGDQL